VKPDAGARGLLIDLDDTLYTYPTCEERGRSAITVVLARDLDIPLPEADSRWHAARRLMFERLGPRAAAHSRLLALAEIVHGVGRPDALANLRRWERLYWDAYMDGARLRDGVVRLFTDWRARGDRIAIVTDLTLEVQLMKLERFDLLGSINALVTSEEVLLDKPDPEGMVLAIARLGVAKERCIVVGDRPEKEGEVARLLGLPYVWVDPGREDIFPAIEAIERLITPAPPR
jgi:HAD superfamily hydrolase (TIGR01549 family)